MEMKEKRKHKFNFVDAIIIIVALIAVAAIAFIFVFGGASTFSKLFGKKETVTIYYAVEFSRVKDDLVDGNVLTIPEGAEVLDEVKNYNIGNYVYYRRNGSEVIGTMPNGETIVSAYPGYSSVIVVVKAEAEVDGYCYLIDGYDLQVGRAMDISVSNFAGSGYCIALSEIENEADQQAFWAYIDGMYTDRVFINDENKDQVLNPTEPTEPEVSLPPENNEEEVQQ